MAKPRGQPIDGWINLDKPVGVTSTAAVGRVRRALGASKAGHAGTLDPLASGILPIALGEATKTVSFAQAGRKTYVFDVIWGRATDTDDTEGRAIAESPARPSRDAIVAGLPGFVGRITQVPPTYSAIKIDGERAYALARRDQEVHLEGREVDVYSFDLIEFYDVDRARFKVTCGSGTYIRSLARDLSKALGTVGHVGSLRRTAVGSFVESGAIALDKLEALRHIAVASATLLPIRTALDDIPALALTAEEARRLRHGQPVALFPVAQRNPTIAISQGLSVQAVLDEALVAIAETGPGVLRPVRVISTPQHGVPDVD
ncbi:MAG: tRNA pseudouridine(55) synthase TruB [Alphaproteobacteria bacterium]|nr:tRNA pseudouridine(55) synthase TruB [Alphaproteobacteria bacterium]